MEARRVSVLIGAGSSIYQCDGVEFRGGLWLVPEWTRAPDASRRQPTRMIRVDHLKCQKPGPFGHDYLLNEPVPKSVLDGSEAKGFEVLHGADEGFWLDDSSH
jgi:hypothetical protein